MKVVTGDVLVDITGRNVSEYLLFTSDRLRLHRCVSGSTGEGEGWIVGAGAPQILLVLIRHLHTGDLSQQGL